MYKILLTEKAKNDLYDAAVYITDNLTSKAAANRLLETANEKLLSLADFPKKNPLVNDKFLSSNGSRVQMINKYLAFYAVHEEKQTVTVIRILHSRRDWISVLKNELNK